MQSFIQFRNLFSKLQAKKSEERIVLGGTAALHAHRVWGAVIFWSPHVPDEICSPDANTARIFRTTGREFGKFFRGAECRQES
jgi:hypothetical protein